MLFLLIFVALSKCHIMAQIPYIFTQLTSFVDRDYFEMLVKRYNGNAYIKSYSCWNHLATMLWAQLTSRSSLRDIECSLRGHREKLYRMGMGTNVSRNTMANANARRDVAIFRELAQRMMERASRIPARNAELAEIGKEFCVNGFFVGDSTTITMNLSQYPWSEPQKGKAGVKLHSLFDLMRQVPTMSLITGHEERDQTFMDDYPIQKGCIYVFDKAYVKTKSLQRINKLEAWYIVRIKDNMKYKVLEEKPLCDDKKVMGDKIIKFTSRWAKQNYPGALRLVQYYSPEKNILLEFITNNMTLTPLHVAMLYKYRWDIETWHKWVKQHLHIVSFYGTSANAVMIQIYVAVTAFCVLALAASAHHFEDSLFEFSRLLSTSLTEKKWLGDLISQYQKDDYISVLSQPKEPSLFDGLW